MENTKKKWLPWFYCLPSFLLIGAIVLFPILYTGYISFTNMNLYHWQDYTFIGIDNYVRALGKVDSGFLSALATTLLWTLVNMLLDVTIAYVLAAGLNTDGLWAKRIYNPSGVSLGNACLRIYPRLAGGHVQHGVWTFKQNRNVLGVS
jgi:arabinogalactan oligomer/maltooligosaccharide transport system permease protein